MPPHYPLLVELIAELDDPHNLARRIQAGTLPEAQREALSVLTFSEAKNIHALLDAYFTEVLAHSFAKSEIVLWSKSGGRFVHAQDGFKAPTLAKLEDAGKFAPKSFLEAGQSAAIARGHYAVPIRGAELCYGALHLFDPRDQAFAPPQLATAELIAHSINGYLKSARMFEQLLGYQRVLARFPRLRIANVAERGIATEVATAQPHCEALVKDRLIDVRLTSKAAEDDPLRPPLSDFSCRARIVWAGARKSPHLKLGLHFEPKADPDHPHAVDTLVAAAKELYLWVQRNVAKDRAGR